MGVGGSPSRRPIGSMQRLVRKLLIELDGVTPQLNEGKFDASLTDNGVGDYTLTFDEAYLRKPLVQVTSQTSETVIEVSAKSLSACTILCFEVDGTTPKDALIDVEITGFDTEDAI